MKISTKGHYALRMLLDLAERQENGYIPLKDVAERQGISKNYLEQIVTLLKNTDVLKTTRGFQGGYKLARHPSSYTVGDIIRLTEGSVSPVACVDDALECERSDYCLTLDVWRGLEQVITEYLDGITLQDIMDKACVPSRKTG
ncbi:MAG: Rrf2 family transcriptional regulator [Gracilibacteraceae bacterium]|nr:Rrf2 family transcriptional regulator [Gracilibacteraceae bacterium]